MDYDFVVEINVPPHIKQEQLESAGEVLKIMMKKVEGCEASMRELLLSLNSDGYPVSAAFAPKEKLPELCVRGFWWAFEKLSLNPRAFDKPEGGMFQ